VETVGAAAAELGVTQVRDPTEHGGDSPARPSDRVLGFGEGSRPAGCGRQLVEQLAHEIAAAVVEPGDLAAVLHGVLRCVLSGVGDHSGMAYDEDLANRVRELIAAEAGLAEQKMFGGLAFLINGHMSVGVSGQGGLMVRVDPAETDALVAKPHARPFEMRGREMRGWLRVDSEGVRTKRQLEPWVRRGVTYARSLPPKG
jgi:TfoX/Sxy family transcriptional regulator of competence genes